MKGRILYAINDIFNVDIKGVQHKLRIKGKYLKNADNCVNVLSPGDWVTINHEYQIIERLPRTNSFSRFSWKNCSVQTLATNLDYVFCILSCQSPPLRQSLLDRLLVACISAGITPWIIITKMDLIDDKKYNDIFKSYQNMGYPLYFTNIHCPDNFTILKHASQGKSVALVGASGVGKSTLINNFLGKNLQKTSAINRKFNVGNHTTNHGIILPREEGGCWIDTPGMRNFSPVIEKSLDECFPDFNPYRYSCSYNNCKHLEEPGCCVQQAVKNDHILKKRYINYCHLLSEETLKKTKKLRYR